MDIKILCLIVNVFLLSVKSSTLNKNTPRWPTNCHFKRFSGSMVLSASYELLPASSASDCQNKCGEDDRCGMYHWRSDHRTCGKFQQSETLLKDIGLPADRVRWAHAYSVSGSRKCPATLSATDCNDYPLYNERKYPYFDTHGISSIKIPSITPALTSDQCQDYCTLYSDCRSVSHMIWPSGWSSCHLFNITMKELENNDGKIGECGEDDPTCGTYDRYCGDDLYDPNNYVPSSKEDLVCPTDMKLYDGATACLPIGARQKDCEAIPGCCYLNQGIALCMRPLA